MITGLDTSTLSMWKTTLPQLRAQRNQLSLNHSIKILNTVFKRPMQLEQALDIYDIYRALMRITQIIASHLPHLKNNWESILSRLHGGQIRVENSYPLTINTTPAQQLLKSQIKPFKMQIVDLKNKEDRQQFIHHFMEIDSCSFRENFSYGFLDDLLSAPEALVIATFDENNHILGSLWGCFNLYEEKLVFHIWKLSIRPEYSLLKIGKNLINHFINGIKNDYPHLDSISLNIERTNNYARAFYMKLGFVSVISEYEEASTSFFIFKINENSSDSPIAASHELFRSHVFTHSNLYQLIFRETIRRSQLLLSWLYWKNVNPDRETAKFNEASIFI